jgi:hypothetical protein
MAICLSSTDWLAAIATCSDASRSSTESAPVGILATNLPIAVEARVNINP